MWTNVLLVWTGTSFWPDKTVIWYKSTKSIVVSLKGEDQLATTLDQLEDKMVTSLGGSENEK